MSDWVLSSPPPADRAAIDDSIDRSIAVLPLIIAGDLAGAMQQLHGKPAVAKTPVPGTGVARPAPASPARQRGFRSFRGFECRSERSIEKRLRNPPWA